ncbi:MAG TPA: hypothetical protein VFZ44_19400 [Pyrinomonadaceae bacterium]
MMKRLLTTFFALALLLTAAPLRVTRAQADAPAAPEEMTDEEEREARALALRFMKRLRETDDFAPLVGEFFPEDFVERVRSAIRETPVGGDGDFLFAFDRTVFERADAAELRRVYVATMNFWNQQELLGNAALDYANLECGVAGEKRPCSWGRHFQLQREAIPAEAFHVAAGDPLFEALFEALLDEGSAGPEPSTEEQAAWVEATMVRDPARLRAFTDRMERCVTFMREATGKLRSEAKSLAAVHSAADDYAALVAAREELKVYKLDDDMVGEEDAGVYRLGLPEGALMIRARVYPFEMVMARVEGRLKILVVYPDVDGD